MKRKGIRKSKYVKMVKSLLFVIKFIDIIVL